MYINIDKLLTLVSKMSSSCLSVSLGTFEGPNLTWSENE